ncbi:hypothetical protein Tco_1237119 [Tanacetum coccineum]
MLHVIKPGRVTVLAKITVHDRRKPRPCGSLLDILTGLTNTTCDKPPRAVSSRLGCRSPIRTQATHACCFIQKPRTYSTPTCIESHANEHGQVVAAVASRAFYKWMRDHLVSIGIDVLVRLGLTIVKRIQFHLSQIMGVPGCDRLYQLLLGYRETSNMSNSDELRHTDNTTLVPPRLPDTLLQVYHRRRPTLGLLILPSVSSFSPTIRCTARISFLPIEPNLAERARISAINLDDYQLDPVTPPPSPSSPFSMAAYQRMIAETDPIQREEALTAYGMETGQSSVPVPETSLTVCTTRLRGQLHTILEDIDRYPNACLEELEAFMTLWDVKPRV